MSDPTEAARRERLVEINTDPGSREALEAKYGKVYDTDELAEDFEVLGFLAPLVVVRRNSDGVKGSLEFQHQPRFYFRFPAAQQVSGAATRARKPCLVSLINPSNPVKKENRHAPKAAERHRCATSEDQERT